MTGSVTPQGGRDDEFNIGYYGETGTQLTERESVPAFKPTRL